MLVEKEEMPIAEVQVVFALKNSPIKTDGKTKQKRWQEVSFGCMSFVGLD